MKRNKYASPYEKHLTLRKKISRKAREYVSRLAKDLNYRESWYFTEVLRRAVGNSLPEPQGVDTGELGSNEKAWEIFISRLEPYFDDSKSIEEFEEKYLIPVLEEDAKEVPEIRLKILLDNLSKESTKRWLGLVYYYGYKDVKDWTQVREKEMLTKADTELKKLGNLPFPDTLGYLVDNSHTRRAIKRWEQEVLIPFLNKEEKRIDREILHEARLPTKPELVNGLKKRQHEIIKEEVETLQKANPSRKTNAILWQLAEEKGKNYEAIKKAYYYQTKKLPKKGGNSMVT